MISRVNFPKHVFFNSLLGLIPARGGSKGIPRKNVQLLAGKPLIAWTIEAALACPLLSRVVVSTEDAEIAAVARSFGADVPFLRPPELARDDTPGIDPVVHAVQLLADEEGYRPDYVMLLQPTSPLRTVEDIEGAIKLTVPHDADSIVSVCEVKPHPYWTMKMRDDGTLGNLLELDLAELQARYPRRQDLPKAYAENGAIYLIKCSVLLEARSFYGKKFLGYVMPAERSLDIDTPWDFHLAELILCDRKIEPPDK